MATPRAGSLPGTVSSAGDELGWLVTSRKPRDEVVDAEVDVDNRVVVDLCGLPSAGGSPPATLLPAFPRAMLREMTGLNARGRKLVWLRLDPVGYGSSLRFVWSNVLRYSPKRNQAIHIPTNIDQGNLQEVDVGGVGVCCAVSSFTDATFITSCPILRITSCTLIS